MGKFNNKVAFVTGGASGIGRALCQELARRGTTVIVTDINEPGAADVALSINDMGGKAESFFLDVTKYDDIEKLIEYTTSKYKRLDYMFNNAGIAVLGEARDSQIDHWRRIVEVNQMGVVYGTMIAYKRMIEQGSGHIINTSSYSGLFGYPLCAPYAMTKHAVAGLSTSLRFEAAGLGVKVTVICPGPVQTNIASSATKLVDESQEKFFLNLFTMGMDTVKAAKVILRGVSWNKAIIIFPFHAKLTWWLYRIYPGILTLFGRTMTKGFRKFVRAKN
jgi:NAD(P)-dependent dehydrogenase (short-subunit alcohol dehydrogenase family)